MMDTWLPPINETVSLNWKIVKLKYLKIHIKFVNYAIQAIDYCRTMLVVTKKLPIVTHTPLSLIMLQKVIA